MPKVAKSPLVKRLSVFARQQTLTPVTTNMNRLVENLESLLVRSLGDFVGRLFNCGPSDSGHAGFGLSDICVG